MEVLILKVGTKPIRCPQFFSLQGRPNWTKACLYPSSGKQLQVGTRNRIPANRIGKKKTHLLSLQAAAVGTRNRIPANRIGKKKTHLPSLQAAMAGPERKIAGIQIKTRSTERYPFTASNNSRSVYFSLNFSLK
ncbi:MAG: hypothetical protein ACTHLD_02045 [Chitinophaga sp.]